MLRRSERSFLATATRRHASVLATADADGAISAMLAPHMLSFASGGCETGGAEATRLLAASFADLDASVLELTGHYKDASRLVLMHETSVVAAAVVHVHVEHGAIEVPIFAAAKAWRRQGYGTTLLALLRAFGRQLSLTTLIVSATDESRAFWLKRGLHTVHFCKPAEKGAVRALGRAGLLRCFANSHLMATSLALDDGAVPGGGAEAEAGGSSAANARWFELIESLERLGAEPASGLPARRAAAALGYVDLQLLKGLEGANFWLRADGTREALVYAHDEHLPLDCRLIAS
jgi:N-acetylglutamate synthase-like GNAT family acetyltransferase